MRNLILLLLCSWPVFSQTEVSLSVQLTNPQTDSIVVSNSKQTFRKVIRNRKGIFNAQLNLPDGFYFLEDGFQGVSIYLKKGYSLTVVADGNNIPATIRFEGNGEKENNFIAQNWRDHYKFGRDYAFLQTKKDYARMKSLLAQRSRALDVKLSRGGFDEVFIEGICADNQREIETYKEIFDEILGIKKPQFPDLKGKLAPAFRYENYKGGTTALSDFKGKYVYIDIWATWCKPCVAEFPDLKKLEEHYRGKNIAFVSISVDKQKDFLKWRRIIASQQLPGTQLFADRDFNSDFIKAFNIEAVPQFILIGPDGKVIEPNSLRPSDVYVYSHLDKVLK